MAGWQGQGGAVSLLGGDSIAIMDSSFSDNQAGLRSDNQVALVFALPRHVCMNSIQPACHRLVAYHKTCKSCVVTEESFLQKNGHHVSAALSKILKAIGCTFDSSSVSDAPFYNA